MKLEAKDLRIGNLLMSGVHECEVWGISQDILRGTVSIRTNKARESDLTDFEPIPLTEEWLKRFGFEKKTYGHFKEIDTPSRMLFLNWNWDESTIYLEDRSGDIEIILPCQYVHQLQNLYFALTGNELELK